MKKKNSKSEIKSAKKQIETSLVSELKAVTGKLGEGTKKLTKKIEKGAKKLAKKIAKEVKLAPADKAEETQPAAIKTDSKISVSNPPNKAVVTPKAVAQKKVTKAPAKQIPVKPQVLKA